MVKRKNEPSHEDGLHMVTALAIGLFFILLGLPLWWKTTTTYRAKLPHNDIHALAHKDLICSIPVILVTCNQEFPPQQLKVTGKLFEEFLNRDSSTAAYFKMKYRVSARSCSQKEMDVLNSQENFEDRDEGLGLFNGQPSSDPQVFLIMESSWSGSHGDIYVGRHNAIYALAEKSGVSPKQRLEDIAVVLKKKILGEESLASVHVTSRGAKLKKADPAMMRAVQSTPGYELSFTLMNSDPSEIIARWNIEQAIHDYLQPFLDRLKTFAEFTVSSQVLHYSQLPLNPKRNKDKAYFYLSASTLPLLINPVETKIGSDVSMYPTLNFLVFIPSIKYRPLYIHDKEDQIVSTNAFFSPRWGGVQVQNPAPPEEENSTLPSEYQVDMKSAMEVYLSQLRLLIGVPNQKSNEDVHFALPGQTALTEWELQALLRKRAVENIATATSTLFSLSKLLEKINNMVINDDIAAEVYSSANCLHKAHDYLAEGELSKAFHFSKKGIISAEKAFFHPSLLELLYFPEDQKFAIYIPLFLPVGIPVVLSLFKAVKWLKAKRKEKQS
ncbi:GPI transamidase component PIG-S-like isoform X1 [Apostichopus japonicus]|uniref:GPI transamidase component PIG-S-like isoform X1 n=1 Tax=Stichopus japonicus TaxID=307972 RepID=UPI003AB71AFD